MDNQLKEDFIDVVRDGKVDIVKTLLSSGANINISDNYGRTPLYIASMKGHIDVIKTLLSSGANINIADNGRTPLYIASDNGHIDVIKTLLSIKLYSH